MNLRALSSWVVQLFRTAGALNRAQKVSHATIRVAWTGTVLLLLAGTSAAQCTLNTASPSVTVCTPSNGATVSSPVSVTAGTTDHSHTVTAMKVYLDTVDVYSVKASQLSTSLAMSNGHHQITVNAWDSSGAVFKTTVQITVSAVSQPVSVSINPTSANVVMNGTQQFTAAVQNSSNTAVTWTASAGTITGSGATITYTAPATAGSYTVTATSVADTTKSASATVTVPPVAVGINPTSASVVVNGTQQFTASVQNASNTAVTWLASAGTITGSGATITYTAPATAGSYTVTATSVADTTKSASAGVTVTSAPPISVSLNPTSATLPENGTQQFTATVQNASNPGVTWTVNGTLGGSSSVGTITGSGLTVTYTAPAIAGNYSVAATSVLDSSKFATANVTVPSTTGFPSSSHVFVVMEENQSFSQVFPSGLATSCSSSGMPYLCRLAESNGLALNFYANNHGSLLAYLYNTSGSAWTGSPSDCTGSACAYEGVITGDNLVRAMTAAHLTWRGYFEDMPYEGYTGGDSGDYLQHHNPFVWYSDVANSSGQQANMYPFTQLAEDVANGTLANFSYIVPNSVHDADEGGSSSTLLSAADNWLSTYISPLLTNAAPFQPGGDGILMVVFDEGRVAGKSGDSSSDNSCSPTQSSGCGGHVAFVMIGPNVISGSTTTNTYHFQDMLHTIIHLLGVPDYMNNASGAADIALLPGVGN